jgi:acetyl-CoA synthetase
MLRQFGEEIIKKHDLSCLRMLGCVGEPINPHVWEWFKEFVGAGRCPIIDTWWQTETGGFMISPVAGINLVKLKPGSVTYPIPGIEAEIVDESGCPVPDGVKGHLIIKKPWPGMFSGIYKDPERYKKYFTNFGGFYYSGDYAIRDSDGYFWILGRADDVMNIAGHRVGTAEVENAAISHSAVVEAAAIGVPDDIKGESLVVFVTLHNGVVASDIIKKEIIVAVRSRIGAFVTPSNVYMVEKLPKTRSGKIMRRVLKAIAQDRSVGDVTTCEDESSVEEIKLAYAQFKNMLLGRGVQHEV